MKRFSANVLLLLAALMGACRPAASSPGTMAGSPEAELRSQLNPANQPPPLPPPVFAAPPPPNPTTIFPVPVRTWLPPAETPDAPRLLAGDLRTTTSAPLPLSETPLLAALISPPERAVLAVPPLMQVESPDPARLTAWLVSNPATELRGLPPNWDRAQLTSDPTSALSRELVLAPPSGLRETPPPFERLNIPDPFEQISIAELRHPPPDNDPPVTTFNLPRPKLLETIAAGK